MPVASFQYIVSSSLTHFLGVAGRQALDAHIMGQYLLIGFLFSFLSSSTFKGTEPLGLKMNISATVSGRPFSKPKLQNLLFPTQPLLCNFHGPHTH